MGKIAFRENSFGFFAEFDLQDMRDTYSAKIGTPRACCIHAQQAIEKLFKHVRKEQGCKPGHPDLTGHHLLHLAEAVEFPQREQFREELLSLSKMYFEGRYPNESEYYLFVMPTWNEVARAVSLAEEVYAWVGEYLRNQNAEEKQEVRNMGIKRLHLD